MDQRPLTIVWLGGASCDGCTMAMLGAAAPVVEDLLLGRVAELPRIELIHPALSVDSGDAYRARLESAARGELNPLVLVLEGSVLDEARAGEGSFSRLGAVGERPLTTANWIDRLASRADGVVAIGTCATWGGIPAAAGNPTGAMGLGEYLGADFVSRGGLPVVNVPGCAPSGDAFLETLVSLVMHLHGVVPLELDADNRPRWLYRDQTSPVPARGAASGPSPEPLESVGCPVPSAGWMRGVGGCARVGGACIACTGRGFPDRYLELTRVPLAG